VWRHHIQLALSLQALIIKRFGNIVRVYASCVASLFAAGISYALFHEAPAPLFYVGCILSMVATLQLQQARTQAAAAAAAGEKQESSQCIQSFSRLVMLLISFIRRDFPSAQGLLPHSTSNQTHASKEAVAIAAGSVHSVNKVRSLAWQCLSWQYLYVP
jgi:hypothetical protein